MNCYKNSTDWVIAETLEDSIKVWESHTDAVWEDYNDHDEFVLLPEDTQISIWFFELPARLPEESSISYKPDRIVVLAKAKDWIAFYGRGFLASTEF